MIKIVIYDLVELYWFTFIVILKKIEYCLKKYIIFVEKRYCRFVCFFIVIRRNKLNKSYYGIYYRLLDILYNLLIKMCMKCYLLIIEWWVFVCNVYI